MQYANKKLFIKLEDFDAIIESIKASQDKKVGGTLFGCELHWGFEAKKISIDANHAEHLQSEKVALEPTEHPENHYLGEWCHHPGFKWFIPECYEDLMKNKADAAAKVQDFTRPVLVLFDLVGGEIFVGAAEYNEILADFPPPVFLDKNAESNQDPEFAPDLSPIDVFVKSDNGLEYRTKGIKLVRIEHSNEIKKEDMQ